MEQIVRMWSMHSRTDQETVWGRSKRIRFPTLEIPLTCCSLAYHEMRLVLATIIWHFDLELCEESDGWLNQKVFAIWQKGPLIVKLKQRSA
jgi:hypothetical protein